MARKKIFSKFADDASLIDTKILEIEESNIEYYDSKTNKYRFKSVFYCESTSGQPRMCVFWDKTSVQIGDEVQLKGRLKDDIFLVWELIIMRRCSNA